MVLTVMSRVMVTVTLFMFLVILKTIIGVWNLLQFVFPSSPQLYTKDISNFKHWWRAVVGLSSVATRYVFLYRYVVT